MAQAAVAAAVKIGAQIAAKITVKAVLTAAAKVVLMAAVNKAVANNSKPKDQGGLISLSVGADQPRTLMIGKRAYGGVMTDWYVRGSKNQNLYFIIYLGEGPMGRLTKVYAGGRVVYSSPINHGVRTTIPNFRSGGDRLWVTYYDGRPGQTADSNLVGQGLGWTSACKGTGVAYAIVEMQWDSDNLQTPPSLAFELEGAKFYDRRKDSTAGGSGSHRHDNPSTWEISSNPAVALDHYLLGRYIGSIKTFGIGVDPADLPYSKFAALANLCDESVALRLGGTQKRYEANGFLFADRSYKDTIMDLCRAMNARPADFGGQIGILDGQPKTPVLVLDEGDIVEVAAEQYSPKRSWADLVSGIEGRYQDVASNYQPIDYPRVAEASWATEDGGQVKYATLDLDMETNAERAQRLAWLHVMRERRQAQLTGIYTLKAVELEQGDWFTRTGGKFGAGKTFEVVTRALDPATLTVSITAFEVDPADTAWDESGAAPDPDAPTPSTDVVPAPVAPVPTPTPSTITGVGGVTLPVVTITIPSDTSGIPYDTIIEVARNNGSGSPTGERLTQILSAGDTSTTIAGLGPGVGYLVRTRAIRGERLSEWGAWVAFTSGSAFVAGSSGSATIADSLVGQGALATLSSLALGGGYLTGFGGLAGLSDVSLGTNVRRGAGPILTDEDAITSLGISLGFIGQGWGATASRIEIANNLVDPEAWGLIDSKGDWVSVSSGGAYDHGVNVVGPSGASERAVFCVTGDSGENAAGRSRVFEVPDGGALVAVWVKPANYWAVFAGFSGSQTANIADGSPNTNPYFSFSQINWNRWMLAVGILQAADSGVTTQSDLSGIWDPQTGQRVIVGSDFRQKAGQTQNLLRFFGYRIAASGPSPLTGHFARPLVAPLSGNAAQTIQSLLMATPDSLLPSISRGADVTGLNVAAGISGQNWGATASIDDIRALSNSPLSVAVSGGLVKVKIGAGSNTSDTVTYTPTGGTAPYTYERFKVGQNVASPVVSATNNNSATFAATATGSVGQEVQGAFVTTITDSSTPPKSVQMTQPFLLAWES